MRLALGLALVLGALVGVPIDPEKIRELLALHTRAKQEEVLPERSSGDEIIEEYLKQRGLKSNPPPDHRSQEPRLT